MAKRKKQIEIPPIAGDKEGAERAVQIARRLGISEDQAMRIIHHYADLKQLRSASVPGLNVANQKCRHIVYWIET